MLIYIYNIIGFWHIKVTATPYLYLICILFSFLLVCLSPLNSTHIKPNCIACILCKILLLVVKFGRKKQLARTLFIICLYICITFRTQLFIMNRVKTKQAWDRDKKHYSMKILKWSELSNQTKVRAIVGCQQSLAISGIMSN